MNKNLVGAMLIGWMLLASCGQNTKHTGTPNVPQLADSPEAGRTNKATKAVAHFWFDYNNQPEPGRRVWVHVDDSTWTELYPGGNQSRYKSGERTTIQGMTGTTVRKVAGDPNQTWTLNDGSFEVFIPDADNQRLILAFRHYQNGRWAEWQPLALIHPID